MVKKTESADTLLLGKEIEWMKKEMEEIKAWQNKIIDIINEWNDKNEKKYAKKEDVDVLKKALIWIVALIVGWVVTALLSKIWL